MTPLTSDSLPALLPSRAAKLSRALNALNAGAPIIIIGDYGSGRTTFGRHLLSIKANEGLAVHRVTGSEALASTPFACLAAFASELSLVPLSGSPANIMLNIAQVANNSARIILLDDVEAVDMQSSAAIASLHSQLPKKFSLIVSARSISDLPPDLKKLVYENIAEIVELVDFDFNDAKALLEDHFSTPFNPSTVNLLFNLCGGNALHLRELAFDAQASSSLEAQRGFYTLRSDWAPGGRRLRDFVNDRMAAWPSDVRQSVEKIAITGPLPKAVATELVSAEVLALAIKEEALVVSSKYKKLDIAQSFDGPGAEKELQLPEEFIQLGAGLTTELVLATLQGHDLQLHREAILGSVSSQDASDGNNSSANIATDRLSNAAQKIVELVRGGSPRVGVQIFEDIVGSTHWLQASAESQTNLIQAMFIAMMAEGSRPDTFDHAFAEINWHDLALDHTVFMTGRGALFMELGDSAQASELFSQALAVSSTHDISGVTFGLGAAAAVMTGDIEKARQNYSKYLRTPTQPNEIAGSLVDLALIPVLLEIEGKDSAQIHHERLLTIARERQEHYIEMRLLHDAWRLKISDDPDLLARISSVAERVEGSLARVLSEYASAWSVPDPNIERLVNLHIDNGRLLFAGELAARAANEAIVSGNRSLANKLMTLFGKAVEGLPRVNTPSLGRVRIDSVPLTERELEVCQLAAEQLSNAEIAETLFLSPRTVEGHLQRAYPKLGVIDRRQLL